MKKGIILVLAITLSTMSFAEVAPMGKQTIKDLEQVCKDIEWEKNKSGSKISYFSPTLNTISFIKVKRENSAITYMKIEINGTTTKESKKGVTILFEDGSKIERPNRSVETNKNKNGGYIVSTLIPLKEQEIEKILQHKITNVSLFINDKEINDGLKLQEYLKCINKR